MLAEGSLSESLTRLQLLARARSHLKAQLGKVHL